jgi:hypothetical protein
MLYFDSSPQQWKVLIHSNTESVGSAKAAKILELAASVLWAPGRCGF